MPTNHTSPKNVMYLPTNDMYLNLFVYDSHTNRTLPKKMSYYVSTNGIEVFLASLSAHSIKFHMRCLLVDTA